MAVPEKSKSVSGLRSRLAFLREFVYEPSAIGAVWPSSERLAEAMVCWVDWTKVRSVVELGPGTGVFTQAILRRARPDCRYLGVEINPQLAALFRQRFPQLT